MQNCRCKWCEPWSPLDVNRLVDPNVDQPSSTDVIKKLNNYRRRTAIVRHVGIYDVLHSVFEVRPLGDAKPSD